MKKLLTLLLIVTLTALIAFSFVGCKEKNNTPTIEEITIAVPDGGPALGMAYLMKNYSEIDGVKVTYKIVDGATGIRAAVSGGEADVALMPTNMAAILYNGGIEIKLVGTNSYGLLYMLSDLASKDTFTLDSLKGQVLNTVGQGGTPEVVLKKILESSNLQYVESDVAVADKVALKFHEDGKTIIAGLKNGTIHYAVLGEPAVSTAIQNVGGNLGIVLDLQVAWKTATNTDASYPQTALVVKESLIEDAQGLVEKIARLTLDGAKALTEDAMPYITYLKEAGATVPATFGAAGVQRTNITPSFGNKAKSDVTAYFTILKAFKAPLIGGKLPDDGFYYASEALENYKG